MATKSQIRKGLVIVLPFVGDGVVMEVERVYQETFVAVNLVNGNRGRYSFDRMLSMISHRNADILAPKHAREILERHLVDLQSKLKKVKKAARDSQRRVEGKIERVSAYVNRGK